MIKDIEGTHARNMASRKYQENLVKDNEEYQKLASSFKNERDESQQKYAY